MFEHVTLLLSFVFAIALTHLMSSATELIQGAAARPFRVCMPSGCSTPWWASW